MDNILLPPRDKSTGTGSPWQRSAYEHILFLTNTLV
jgi:hypothetical protein